MWCNNIDVISGYYGVLDVQRLDIRVSIVGVYIPWCVKACSPVQGFVFLFKWFSPICAECLMCSLSWI